jgi:hypothetical protein
MEGVMYRGAEGWLAGQPGSSPRAGSPVGQDARLWSSASPHAKTGQLASLDRFSELCSDRLEDAGPVPDPWLTKDPRGWDTRALSRRPAATASLRWGKGRPTRGVPSPPRGWRPPNRWRSAGRAAGGPRWCRASPTTRRSGRGCAQMPPPAWPLRRAGGCKTSPGHFEDRRPIGQRRGPDLVLGTAWLSCPDEAHPECAGQWRTHAGGPEVQRSAKAGSSLWSPSVARRRSCARTTAAADGTSHEPRPATKELGGRVRAAHSGPQLILPGLRGHGY